MANVKFISDGDYIFTAGQALTPGHVIKKTVRQIKM